MCTKKCKKMENRTDKDVKNVFVVQKWEMNWAESAGFKTIMGNIKELSFIDCVFEINFYLLIYFLFF